ncbi:hypothetical protein [Pikeienuella sp. HZG-20]|uniref:hypothetical protein n=1 Tax=Paludibacillus litoralis TaxID=3133267 RepID=UPI0030EE82EC
MIFKPVFSSFFHRAALAALTTAGLAGCVATVRGAPEESFARSSAPEDWSFKESIVNATLDRDRIVALATNGATVAQRNEVIFARLAELDSLYFAYERDLSKELRESGFAATLAQIAVGAAGSVTGQQASQILSAVSAGIAGSREAFEKEILIDRTMQAFISQMRAGRDQMKRRILLKLGASADAYPLQAAVSDLEAYRQAGTLTGALAGISADASEKETAAQEVLAAAEAKIIHATYGESEAARLLNAYINEAASPAEIARRTRAIGAAYEGQPSSLRDACPGGADGVLYASAADPDCRRIAENLLELFRQIGEIQ